LVNKLESEAVDNYPQPQTPVVAMINVEKGKNKPIISRRDWASSPISPAYNGLARMLKLV